METWWRKGGGGKRISAESISWPGMSCVPGHRDLPLGPCRRWRSFDRHGPATIEVPAVQHRWMVGSEHGTLDPGPQCEPAPGTSLEDGRRACHWSTPAESGRLADMGSDGEEGRKGGSVSAVRWAAECEEARRRATTSLRMPFHFHWTRRP